MYLLGSSAGTFETQHPKLLFMPIPNEGLKLGGWNFRRYGKPLVDQLLQHIQRELAPPARQGLEARQRSDNFFLFRWVRVDG